MKFLWIGILALLPAAVLAASPEQAYLAARDAQIRRLTALSKPDPSSDKVLKEHEQAVAELEKQLKRIIGPSALAVPGLPADGKINNDTLTKDDMGFGMLDGLRYSSEDDKTQVVVTTEGLFKAWLPEHRSRSRDDNVPQDPASALRQESFYTQAMSSDAAVFKYVELPIKKPAAASLAFAMLGISAQDVGPWQPKELTVSVLQGGKLYLVHVEAHAKVGPFPACEAVWKQATQKTRRSADLMEVEDKAYAAFRRCFAERAPHEKGFADLVREAQDIAEKLPAK